MVADRRIRLLLLLAAAGLLAVAAGLVAGLAQAVREPFDVVVVVLDTTRRDRLSFYGHDAETMPFLAGLARESVVFDAARAPSSWTAPSTASLFTSTYPNQHGVFDGLAASKRESTTLNRIPDEHEVLPEAMVRAGYRTFGIADNLNVGPAIGFERGFERFVSENYAGASRVNAVVHEWLDELRGSDAPTFLYLHYMDPHAPLHAREPGFEPRAGVAHVREVEAAADAGAFERPSGEDLRDIAKRLAKYDSELTYVDRHLAELYELLDWGEDTLLVVTSDHGEEFLDHGGIGHGHTLWSELVDVPLLVHFPARFSPRRVPEDVSLVDLLPTLRELVGAPPSPQDVGISLVPALEGRPLPDRAIYSYLGEPGGLAPFGEPHRAVWRGAHKLVLHVESGRGQLFDVAADPAERTDLAGERADEARQLLEELEQFEATAPIAERSLRERRQSREESRRLRALGYVE